MEGYWETITPTSYPKENITCFADNNNITITANPKGGYQFVEWEFSLWPPDLAEDRDKTANPLTFRNTNTDYPDNEYVRIINAHFTPISAPPPTVENLNATDGKDTGRVIITWDSAPGADYYRIYSATSRAGDKTMLNQTNDTSYEDTSVISDNLYYYWVQAVNNYGEGRFSEPDSGYAYVEEQEPPPAIEYEPSPMTPSEAKDMLDTDPTVIVVDISSPTDYERNHILCAINRTWTELFGQMQYQVIDAFKDYPILVYDQDGASTESAAKYLAERDFSKVYYLIGGFAASSGFQQWIASGYETVDSDDGCECALPPIALAGQDQSVNENEPVVLDGSGSQAADDSALTYEWSQFKGTDVVIENPSTVQPRFTSPYVQEGGEKLVFHVMVTDAENNQDTDSVAVTVRWKNSPPIADPGGFQSVLEGETVILDGSGSTDRDDGIVTYEWEQTSGPKAEIADSGSESARFIAPDVAGDAAELTFELTVTDKGGLSDSAQVTVLVSRNNSPPAADAGPDQEVSETHKVQLDGSGSSDVDNNIENYTWTQVGADTPTVQLSNPSDIKPHFMAPEVTGNPIVLKFQLTVTDADGAQNTDQVSTNVLDVGDPPEANAGMDQRVYPGWWVTLDGSGTVATSGSMTSDNAIKNYQWHQVSGPDVTIKDPGSPKLKFTAPEINTESVQLIFQLNVTDMNGLTGTDRVKILVQKAVDPPTANAGEDQEIKENKRVVLDGTGSNDPDDGIDRYSWRQIGGGPDVELSDTNVINPEFTTPEIEEETTLDFELTVTDFAGNKDTDQVQVRILPESSDNGGSCFIKTLSK